MTAGHTERGLESHRDVVTCAASGCGRKGYAVKGLDLELGGQVLAAPNGWGELEAHQDDGNGGDVITTLYVCSPSCERRLAWALSTPTLGELT